jgi:dienelactone hydrolase
MGYCFGGAAALELARSGEADNVAGYATFHGGLTTPEGQRYPSDTPPILVMHGGADASITMDDVAALSRQLEKAGVTYEIEV